MRSTKVLNPGAPVGCERLRLVQFSYVGFDGATHDDGELVVLDAVADHVLAIFVALRSRAFPSPVPADESLSWQRRCLDGGNNTSAFNVRRVEGTNSMSLHAYGLAIDLNPIQNPYVERGARGIEISPPAGAGYVGRQNRRPGMAEAVVDLFAHHGFAQWGGYWPRGIDYQHFQVGRRLAGQLVTLPYPKARAAFEQHVERVRTCMQAARQKGQRSLGACARLDAPPVQRAQQRDVLHVIGRDETVHRLVEDAAAALCRAAQHQLAVILEDHQPGVEEIEVRPPRQEADDVAVLQHAAFASRLVDGTPMIDTFRRPWLPHFTVLSMVTASGIATGAQIFFSMARRHHSAK